MAIRPASLRRTKISLGLLFFIYADAFAYNLIANGSFESGADLADYSEYNPGSAGIDNWLISRGEVDYIGGLWQHADGQRSVELDYGGVSQTINTVAGQTYIISFWIAGNPQGTPIKEIRSRAGEEYRDFSFDISGASFAEMGWVNHTWSFVALGNSTELEFYTLTPSAYGVALDNIQVTADIADQAKPEISVRNGYFNLSVTNGGLPPDSDCLEPADYGRMVFDEVNQLLHLCSEIGWIAK